MENQQTPFKAGLNAGLILGVISILTTFIVYFIDPAMLASGTVQWSLIGLSAVILVYFGIQYRKTLGGFIDFGPAFNFSFIGLLVSALVGFLGTQLLYNVIDPSLPGVLIDATLENMISMAERFGGEGVFSSAQIDEMRENMEDSFTFLGQLKAIGFLSIGYAILSLITGAIIKKRDKSLDY